MQYKIINGAITYGTNTILEEINFEINSNDKIAIIGKNGSGKSSLLKSLIDNEILETGLGEEEFQIIKIGKPKIGYQEQQSFSNLDITLIDEILKIYSPITNLKGKINKLEKELEINATSELIEEYTNSLEKYKLIGGYTYQKEYEIALTKFGFTKEEKDKKLSEFSGGQRTKISFIKLLLSKPDILILDEPTNHLDIEAIEWLENYLSNYPKSIVVVSHDRMFLDKVVNKVYEIEYASLTKYNGNYTSYEIQKKMNYEKQLADYEYQQKEIKRLKLIADRFKYKPSKASMAMSKLKKIEQMTQIDKPTKPDVKNWKIASKTKNESSNNVLSVKELEIGYNNIPLSKVSFELYKGQKLAIIGANGIGKSTLIKTIIGIIPKISGKYSYGYNVKKEYFDQQIEFLNEENTIYEEYSQTFPEEIPLEIRKNLGSFLFVGDDVFKKIKVLSGGEKVRLQLCKIFKKNPNLLLLDEPTNHLDILGKENLEDILSRYDGTILFISHDRYFINKIADSLLIFENNKVTYFNGKYEKYLEEKNKESNISLDNKKIINKKEKIIPNKEIKEKKKLINKLEKEIENKEIKKKEIETMMLEEKIYNDYLKMNILQNELEKITKEIDDLMKEWEELNL